jgi:hypothetical protein
MQVDFKVRAAELQNATDQLLVNRGRYDKRRDFADVLVSEVIATLRTTGTSAEIPVAGLAFGAARIPLMVLEQVARVVGTYKQREIRVTISEGVVKVESWRTKHAAITVGTIPDLAIDLPVDATLLDTLGLGSALSESQLAEQGLTKRVKHAKKEADRAIHSAAGHLAALGISAAQVRALVQSSVQEAGKRLLRLMQKGSPRTHQGSSSKKEPLLFD